MHICLTSHGTYRALSPMCVRDMICLIILYNKVERFKDMNTCVRIFARAIRIILVRWETYGEE